MKPLTPEARRRLAEFCRTLHRECEAEFQYVLEAAKDKLPAEADHLLFPVIVRGLWQHHSLRDSGFVFTDWLRRFPSNYSASHREHRGLLEDMQVRGDVAPTGVRALARLLVGLRRRQRLLEGEQ